MRICTQFMLLYTSVHFKHVQSCCSLSLVVLLPSSHSRWAASASHWIWLAVTFTNKHHIYAHSTKQCIPCSWQTPRVSASVCCWDQSTIILITIQPAQMYFNTQWILKLHVQLSAFLISAYTQPSLTSVWIRPNLRPKSQNSIQPYIPAVVVYSLLCHFYKDLQQKTCFSTVNICYLLLVQQCCLSDLSL